MSTPATQNHTDVSAICVCVTHIRDAIPGQQVLTNKGKDLARCNEQDVHQHDGNQRHCHTSAGRVHFIVSTLLHHNFHREVFSIRRRLSSTLLGHAPELV